MAYQYEEPQLRTRSSSPSSNPFSFLNEVASDIVDFFTPTTTTIEEVWAQNRIKYEQQLQQVVREVSAIAVASVGAGDGADAGGGGGIDPDDRKRIVAAILSIIISGGAVALIGVHGATLTPNIILWKNILIQAGNSGLKLATGDEFTWSEWCWTIGKASLTTLITFYGGSVGNYVGLALRDSSISTWQLKAIAGTAGALVSALLNGVSFVLICTVKGEEKTTFGLCSDMAVGGLYGYLAVETPPSTAFSKTTKIQTIDFDEGTMQVEIKIVDDGSRKIAEVIGEIAKDFNKKLAVRYALASKEQALQLAKKNKRKDLQNNVTCRLMRKAIKYLLKILQS